MTRRCRLCDSHVAAGHLLCEGCEAALRAKTPAERKAAFMRGWQQVYIDACSRQQGTPKRCPTMDEQEATAVARWFARLYSGEFRDWKDSAVDREDQRRAAKPRAERKAQAQKSVRKWREVVAADLCPDERTVRNRLHGGER